MRREGDRGGQDDRSERGERREEGREGERKGDWVAREEGPSGKLIAAGVVGVLLLIFVLQNTNEVQMDFLFWDGGFPLWGVIVVAAALGFVGGWILGRVRRSRREVERLRREAEKD